jgi:hypothetical protein
VSYLRAFLAWLMKLLTPTPPVDWQVDDPVIRSRLTIVPATGRPYWRITQVRYEPPAAAGNRHNCYVRAEDADGANKLGVYIKLAWPDGQDTVQKTEIHDQYYPTNYYADQPLYGGSWNPAHGPGPYTMSINDVSETLAGMGLPMAQHVNYYVVFRRTL